MLGVEMKLIVTRPMMDQNAARQRSIAPVEIATVIPGYSMEAASEYQADIFIPPSTSPLRATRRIVVLVPDGSLDETALARRVWQLASSASLKVLFLTLSPDLACVAPFRRRLALLASAVQQDNMSARTSVVVGSNWLQAVEEVLQAGDLLVCLACHKVPYFGIGRRKLGDSLAVAFQAPVYMLGGLSIGDSPTFHQRVQTLGAWGLSIVILVAFAGLQIWLSQNINTRLAPILISLSIIAEGITLFKTIDWMG
jgi:hypothetical protein